MDKKKLFGFFLRKTREKAGLSRGQFALKAMYNIDGIQKIERGDREPKIMLAVQLAEATGVDLGDFFRDLLRIERGELELAEKESTKQEAPTASTSSD